MSYQPQMQRAAAIVPWNTAPAGVSFTVKYLCGGHRASVKHHDATFPNGPRSRPIDSAEQARVASTGPPVATHHCRVTADGLLGCVRHSRAATPMSLAWKSLTMQTNVHWRPPRAALAAAVAWAHTAMPLPVSNTCPAITARIAGNVPSGIAFITASMLVIHHGVNACIPRPGPARPP